MKKTRTPRLQRTVERARRPYSIATHLSNDEFRMLGASLKPDETVSGVLRELALKWIKDRQSSNQPTQQNAAPVTNGPTPMPSHRNASGVSAITAKLDAEESFDNGQSVDAIRNWAIEQGWDGQELKYILQKVEASPAASIPTPASR